MPENDDRRAFLDWCEAAPAPAKPPRRRRDGGRTRPAVLAALAIGLIATPFGVAATGDVLREGVRNGTTQGETEIIGRIAASSGAKGGYVTRQSNIQTGSGAGGAAIYGCRGAAGGTAAGSAPCLRASNLANGLAFEFASKSGPAGLLAVGAAADPPFVTNGAGLVANLNADKVDGKDAAELVGAQGPPGPAGPAGATGPQGEPGSALAFMRLDGSAPPTVGIDTAFSKNIEGITVTHPFTGLWCFYGLPFTARNIQAQVETGTPHAGTHASIVSDHLSCSGSEDAWVAVFDGDPPAGSDRPVSILFN